MAEWDRSRLRECTLEGRSNDNGGERVRRVSTDQFVVTCPYCGEDIEIYIEPDVTGSFVQDCEVCCNPWRVRVSCEDGDRSIDIGRADGSE